MNGHHPTKGDAFLPQNGGIKNALRGREAAVKPNRTATGKGRLLRQSSAQVDARRKGRVGTTWPAELAFDLCPWHSGRCERSEGVG